jgi:histidinol-phosphate aminotransferase
MMLRSDLAQVPLYAVEPADVPVDLSDNTSMWGPAPSALAAAQSMPAGGSLTRYPELYSASVKQAVARYLGVDPEMVVVGNGSDGVIDAAIRAVAAPGERLAYMAPTFGMIPVFARVNGLVPVAVPLLPSLALDVPALLAAEARVTFVCSPNNPTGHALARQDIEAVIDGAAGMVIVDEAYAEFAGTSVVELVRRSPRLLVTRTLSKAFGLAGLRVGYGIAQPELVRQIEKSRGPYAVTAASERAAVAALDGDVPWMRQQVQLAVEARQWLVDALRDRGLEPLPSAANFVLVPVADAESVALAMLAHGVSVRAFSRLPQLTPALVASAGAALRITVGPMNMQQAALDALDAVRS